MAWCRPMQAVVGEVTVDEMTYLDFDLLIQRSGQGYVTRVLNSPVGQEAGEFGPPFSQQELELFLLRVGRPRRGVRRLESPEMEAARRFGTHLFEAVFGGAVGLSLQRSLDEARRQGAGLRLRLRLAEVPELADLPWEYLFDAHLDRFLSLSVETPIVRYLDLPEPVHPLAVTPPLRVLVMISSPHDFPALDVEGEWSKLKTALQDLVRQGLVVLEKLETATLAALQRQLHQSEYHVFHFVGHGEFDERVQDGVLLLEDEQGRGRRVSGRDLGTLLHDERSLRLVVLNACEGARAAVSDPFAGAAQGLVWQGIPAIIAMQFEITDEAAATLALWFYSMLAQGHPVDAALAETRKAIFAAGNDVEWGTPVLYMRSPDGDIFDVGGASPSLSLPAGPGAPAGPLRLPVLLPLQFDRVRHWLQSLPASTTTALMIALGYCIGWLITRYVSDSLLLHVAWGVVEPLFHIEFDTVNFALAGALFGLAIGLLNALVLRWIEPSAERKHQHGLVVGWTLGLAALAALFRYASEVGEASLDDLTLATVGALGWSVGGLIIGLALRRIVPAVRWKEVLGVEVAWVLGQVLGVMLAGPSDPSSAGYLAVSGAVGGLGIGLALRRAEPATRWEQVPMIAIGWLLGGAIHGMIADSRLVVNLHLAGLAGSVAAGLVGSLVMLWQPRQSRQILRSLLYLSLSCIGWSVGCAVAGIAAAGTEPSTVQEPGIWLVLAGVAAAWFGAGLLMAIALRWLDVPLGWRHILVTGLGWALGGTAAAILVGSMAMRGRDVEASLWLGSLLMVALAGGLAVGLVLRWTGVLRHWKQILVVVGGWLVASALWGGAWAPGAQESLQVWDGIIPGIVGGGAMLWQISRSMRGAEE